MTRFVRTLIGAATGFALAITAACSSSSSLPAGYENCKDPSAICIVNGAATCTDLSTTANCGACGNACATPGSIYSASTTGAVACTAGACVASCTNGGTICGVAAASTSSTGGLICTDTKQDPNNCGACGIICKTTESCVSGACAANSVETGRTLCGGTPGTPIYRDLNTDPQNCGTCGNACGAGMRCSSGACVGCPVATCPDPSVPGALVCIDLNNDPKNCGACGAAVSGACVGGKPFGTPSISALSPAPLANGTVYAYPSPPTTTLTVQVDSGVRIAHVLATANNGSSNFLYELRLVGGDDLTRSYWALDFTNPGTTSTPLLPAQGSTVTVNLIAYDEQCYLGGGAAAGSLNYSSGSCVGHVSSATSVTIYVLNNLPSATAKTPTLAIGGVTTTNPDNYWVPLNGPKITLTAQLQAAVISLPQPTLASFAIELRTGPFGATAASSVPVHTANGGRLSLPPGPSTSPTASVEVAPVDLGLGPRSLYACPIDFLGNTPESSPGILNCSALAAKINIGAVDQTLGGGHPVLTRGADANHTIWLAGTVSATGCPLLVQAHDKPVSDPAKIGKPVGETILCNSLYPIPDYTGVVALRESTSTLLGAAVSLFDGASPPSEKFANWIKAPSGTSWSEFERNTLPNIGRGIALKDQNGGLWFATADLNSSSNLTPAYSTGTPIAVPGANGEPSTDVKVTGLGTLAAFVQTGTRMYVELFDPRLTGNLGASGDASHVQTYPLFFGTSTPTTGVTPKQLTVFPGGEVVWEWTDATGTHFLGAARFDGSVPTQMSTGPTAKTFWSYGTTSTPDNLTANWVEPKPGLLIGAIPNNVSSTNWEVVVIDFTSGSPSPVRPVQWNGQIDGVGPLSRPLTPLDPYMGNGVQGLLGGKTTFTVSDDGTKVLFKTFDRHAALNASVSTSTLVSTLYLYDVATGAASQLQRSAYLDDSVIMLPHFLRGTGSYTPTSTAGWTAVPNVAVWGERLPVNSSKTHLEKIWFASLAGGTPAPVGVDRFTPFTYDVSGTSTYNLAWSAAGMGYWESAKANGVFFLSDGTAGAVDLYFASFGGSGSSQLVQKGVAGFRVREDKARILLMTSDGLLRAGSLGSSGATGMVTIAEGGFGGTLDPGLSATWGLTPDGDHAWYLAQPNVSLFLGPLVVDGQLITIDLASKAQTNWGRAVWALAGNGAESPPFLTGNSLFAFDWLALWARDRYTFWGASSSAPLTHANGWWNPEAAGSPGSEPRWSLSTSIDGNEAVVGGSANAILRTSATSVSYYGGMDTGPSVTATYLRSGSLQGYGQARLPLFSAGGNGVGGQAWAKYWGGSPIKDPVLISWDASISWTTDQLADTNWQESVNELLYRFSGPGGQSVMVLDAPSHSSQPKPPYDASWRP